MNPKEKDWLKSCIDYLLKMHGNGESIRMINVAFMPERPAGVFPDDEKAKQALFSEIARVAEEGKLLKPQPIGDIWHRPGKPPLVMKVENFVGMMQLGSLIEDHKEDVDLLIRKYDLDDEEAAYMERALLSNRPDRAVALFLKKFPTYSEHEDDMVTIASGLRTYKEESMGMKRISAMVNEGTEVWKTGAGKWWLLGTVMMEPVSPFFDKKDQAVDYGIKSGRFNPSIRDRLMSEPEDGIGFPADLKGEAVRGMSRLTALIEGVPEQHQIRVAINTLRMAEPIRGVMGGMTKTQARDVLVGAGWSTGKIASLEGNPFEEAEYAFEMGDSVRIVGNVDGKGKSGRVDYSKNGFAVVVDKNGKGIGSFHWSDLKLKSEEGAWPLMSEPSR